MNLFEMMVVIVAIVMIAGVIKAQHRREAADDSDHPDSAARAEIDRLRAEVQALKARVATLERIVTDGSTRLEHEIEALRDRA